MASKTGQIHGRDHVSKGADPVYGGAIAYDYLNVGNWLSIEADTATNIAGGVISGSVDIYAPKNGIVLRAGDGSAGYPTQPEWALTYAQMIYYLDGVQDIGYSQGGDILRYSGGGNILFYTTDGALPNCGDFLVYTNGSNDASKKSGDIQLSTYDNGGGAGDISLLAWANSGTPGYIMLATDNTSASLDDGEIGIFPASGKPVTVYDSSGYQIFRVDEDGAVHIKTGQTIAADL